MNADRRVCIKINAVTPGCIATDRLSPRLSSGRSEVSPLFQLPRVGAGQPEHVWTGPRGRPLAARETVPVKPPSADTVIVSRPLCPRGICSVFGEADRAKSAAELTVSFTLME